MKKMYFNKKNNFFHGIMFHHFHDNLKHKKSQGSISKDDFYRIIKFIGRENILDANLFQKKLKNNKLKKNEVCFTFDDSVKSQIDVALPVLEELKIKSFFFVYSSIFENKPDNLEFFRYFRMNYFDNINDFYNDFFKVLNRDLSNFFSEKKLIIQEKKNKFPHYSEEDIKFRLVRDQLLGKTEYEKLMLEMMKIKNFDPKTIKSEIFFNKVDVINLNKLGHSIGLHSHSHPTSFKELSHNDQEKEYKKNLYVLAKILNKKENDIRCMSHPCGSYNENTLKVLKGLGIEIGFKQIMQVETDKGMLKINNTPLEIARQDHAEIIRRIKE